MQGMIERWKRIEKSRRKGKRNQKQKEWPLKVKVQKIRK